MSSAEPTRRDFLYIATGAVGAVGARRGAGAADRADEPGRLDHRRRRPGRGRSRARSPRARSSRCSGAASRSSSATAPRKRSRRRSSVDCQQPARSAGRLGARQGRPRPVAGPDRHLHPSRLHPARAPGRLRRLVLPLPRLAIRHLRPHPARARRRRIWRCRPTNSSPTPRSGSAEEDTAKA